MELRHYWNIIWTRRWMIGIMAVSAAVVALAMTYFLSPTYEASAVILVRPQLPGLLEDGLVQKETMGFPVNMNPVKNVPESYTKIIQGRTIAKRLVDRMGAKALIDPEPQNWLKRAYKWLKDTTKGVLFKTWMLLRHGYIAKVDPYEAVVGKVQGSIKAKAITDTWLFEINVALSDPALAAAVANTAAEEFVAYQLESNRQEFGEQVSYFGGELERIQERERQIRREMEDYKAKYGFTFLEGQAEVELSMLRDAQQTRFTVEHELAGLRKEKEKLEEILARTPKTVYQGRMMQENPRVVNLEKMLQVLQTDLAGAREMYTDTHPEVKALQAKVKDVETKLAALRDQPRTFKEDEERINSNYLLLQDHLALVEQDLARHEAQLPTIVAEIDRLQKIVNLHPAHQKFIAEHKLELDNLEKILKDVTKAYEEARIEGNENWADIRVVHEATPPAYPKGPIKIYWVLGAAALAAVLGAALAFLFEYLNIRVRTIAEAERILGIPVLATLPHMEDLSGFGADSAAAH
ncbi:MAG: hypothetical protein KC466_00375 [Myxococcales bacterium]|nr:hypothetical protein [Myxococcales bacterium]